MGHLACLLRLRRYERHLNARHVANEKKKAPSSFITCDWFSVSKWHPLCPHPLPSPCLVCLDCVLRNAGLISLDNYSSPLFPSCGLQSVKQRHVSRCSEEKVYETPVSGNNSSSVRAALATSSSFSSRRFCNYLPGHSLVNLVTSSYPSSNGCSLWELRYFFFFFSYLDRLEWHFSPPLQPTLESLGDSPQRHMALQSSEYLSERTSKYVLDEQFNGL